MSFFKDPDWDQKLFDKLVDLGGKAIDSGYASAWFTWIGWVAITGLLFFAFEKSNSIIALLAANLSVLLLFFVALAAVKREIDKFSKNSKLNLWLSLVIVLCASFGTPFVVIAIMEGILSSAGT